jgi:5-methylthioadenosine/S-adenosylhomocysteine deaminase
LVAGDTSGLAEAAVLGRSFVRDGTELAIVEMLRGGTTCANENYFFPDVSAATYHRLGLRACVGLAHHRLSYAVGAFSDDEYFERALAVHDDWRGNPLITTAFAPHAPYTVKDASFERIALLARQLNLQVHCHVHETAQEIADSLEPVPAAALGSPAATGSAQRATDRRPYDATDACGNRAVCCDQGVSVVHCPESNLKLASGFCPAAALHRKLAYRLALGTDGCASNNDLDMLGEMRTAALLAKGVALDAAALDAAVRPCAWPPWVAPERWRLMSRLDRSKLANRPISLLCASTCPRCSRSIIQFRRLFTRARDTMSVMSGLLASASWPTVPWSRWTSSM